MGLAGFLFGNGPRANGFAPPLPAQGSIQKKGLPRHPTPHKGRRVEYAPNVVLVTYAGLNGGPAPVGPIVSGPQAMGGGGGGLLGARSKVEALGLKPEFATYRRFYYRYHLTQAAIARGETVESMIAKISAISGVRSAEPDMAIYKDQVPNDPGFDLLWGLDNQGQDGGTVDADIDAPEAWAMLPDGNDVLVAVLDDGVDLSHPDLADNIAYDFRGNLLGFDTADDDADPNPTDPDFEQHGTHVAGTIAAVMNNSIGVTGVGKRVKIMPIRMYSGQFGWMSDLSDGLEYARLNGASVVNVSYNIDGYGSVLLDAVKRLDAFDIIYVNSAGNNGVNMDQLRGTMKAKVNNAIFVAATDRNDNIASFSNFGKTTTIAAPGVDILSTIPGDNYEFFSGTSMATPHVAGAIAVMRAMYPQWNAKQILAKVENSSQPLVSLDGKISGGRLNLRNMLEYDVRTPGNPTNVNVVDRSTTTFGVVFQGSGDDGNTGTDVTYEVWASDKPITNANVLSGPSHTINVTSLGGGLMSANLDGLEPGKGYYVAVRARDNVGTYSQLTQIGPVTTATASWRDGMDTASGWVSNKWHIVEKSGFDGTRAFMDSHSGAYANDTDTSLTMAAPIKLTAASLMRFRAKLALEEGYDYLYVETSLDGGQWVTRAAFTGDKPWAQYQVSLGDIANKNLLVRFRLVSDESIVEDGVVIDDVSFAPLMTIYREPATSSTNWRFDLPWALSKERFVSSPTALNDSPATNYADDLDISATFAGTIDTTTVASPSLVYKLWNDLEEGWDFLDIETSTGVGGTLSPWTFRKTATGTQDWHSESVALPSVPNLTYRFRLVSDFIFNQDGVSVDDVEIVGEKKQKISFVEIMLNLDGYNGSVNGRTVNVFLLDPVTNAVKYSFASAPLYSAGSGKAYVRVTVPAQGSYKVRVGAAPWLYQVLGTYTLAVGNNSVGGKLTLGDVTGNNVINSADLTKLRTFLGSTSTSSNWNALYDLNGDNEITSADEAIITRNLGQIGQ